MLRKPATCGRQRRSDNEDATSDENDAFWRTILAPLTDLALASIHVGGHLWGQYLGLRNDPATLLDYARVPQDRWRAKAADWH
jgi:hypothetical protein